MKCAPHLPITASASFPPPRLVRQRHIARKECRDHVPSRRAEVRTGHLFRMAVCSRELQPRSGFAGGGASRGV